MEKPTFLPADAVPCEIDVGDATIASSDPRMGALFFQIRRLASTRLPILIHGESGVGKEMVARAVHANAPWRAGPFVPINCGAMPAGLIESELFGHERGAFSGATETKMGLLEAASGGTVLLDEIGEFPLDLQARLLRFLDDHLVRRVGGLSEKRVDVRVVSATNRDLHSFVGQGLFREDLFHRLTGALLSVPPLRDRRTDLLRLATQFLAEARARAEASAVGLSDGAALAMLRYRWPGNVRELKHAMEFVAATFDGEAVALEHLPSPVQNAASSDAPRVARHVRASTEHIATSTFVPIKEQIAGLVRTAMADALLAAHGNVARAARLLRMSRRTFIKKMKMYGLRDLRRA